MLEFKKRELKFKWDDSEYTLMFPTVQKIKQLQKMQKEEKDEIDVLEDFLCDLGMDKKVFNEMEVEYITQIVDTLVNPKKA